MKPSPAKLSGGRWPSGRSGRWYIGGGCARGQGLSRRMPLLARRAEALRPPPPAGRAPASCLRRHFTMVTAVASCVDPFMSQTTDTFSPALIAVFEKLGGSW